MDARFARDAILEAEANRAAMQALIPDYLANTKVKIAKVEARLNGYRSGKRQSKRAPLEQTIAGLERRLAKLRAKGDTWQAHLEAGMLPPIIFGSAAAFHARRKGQMSHADWQRKRRAQFWSRGENSGDRGTQHARVRPNGDEFTISLVTLPMVNGRLAYYTATLWLPAEKKALLSAGLADSYAVRIIRQQGQWHAHITNREVVGGKLLKQAPADAIAGGLDCNTDRLTLGVASPQGNLLARHTVWMPDLGDMRANQAAGVIGKALTESMDWLEAQRVMCLVVEKLKLAQDHDTHHRFNRSTTKFRSTLVKLAVRLAL